jgi:hypothetical protein
MLPSFLPALWEVKEMSPNNGQDLYAAVSRPRLIKFFVERSKVAGNRIDGLDRLPESIHIVDEVNTIHPETQLAVCISAW